VDQKLSRQLYGGAEISARRSRVPVLFVGEDDTRVTEPLWREEVARTYLYWAPWSWLALSAEYQYERLKRDDPIDEGIFEVQTHKIPLAVSIFDPGGFLARLQATYVDQHGTFADATGAPARGADRFVIVDALIGYRLPRRSGLVTVEARNLLDSRFRFQDTDPVTPRIYPERLILGKVTLAF
jgi:hypothetical protein